MTQTTNPPPEASEPRSRVLETPSGPLDNFEDGAHDPDPELEDLSFSVGDTNFEFGEWCKLSYLKGEGEDAELIEVPFARNVWPLALYKHVDEDEFGVRFAYLNDAGDIGFSTIGAGAFTDRTAKQRAAREQSQKGVRILQDQGENFGRAMGAVRDCDDLDLDVVRVTSTPGWHEGGDVYVNGNHYIWTTDDEGWYADENVRAIADRSTRSGSARGWSKAVDEEITTVGLRAAIGVSLAGPLVEFLGRDSFMVHFYGASSIGKSRAAIAAGSIWGASRSVVQTWNATQKALSNLANLADGSCLILDEIGQFGNSERKLARTAYDLVANEGRDRLKTTGELRDRNSWRITALSTGEQSLGQKIGRHAKGGQLARVIDINVGPGELTEDAEHAERLDETFTKAGAGNGEYGHTGDAWTAYLVNEASRDTIREARNRWGQTLAPLDDGTPEGGRILDHFALVGAALEHGREANLLPWGDEEIEDTISWLAERAMAKREGGRTPNERALRLLWQHADTKPAHFPSEKTVERDKANQDIWGIKDDGTLFTSENHFKESDIPENAGVGPRDFLDWAAREGHAEKVGRTHIGGIRKTWYRFSQDD